MESPKTQVDEGPMAAITVVHSGSFGYSPDANELEGFPQWVTAMDRNDSPIREFFSTIPPPKRVRIIVSIEVYDGTP